jgi:hypothetical protein
MSRSSEDEISDLVGMQEKFERLHGNSHWRRTLKVGFMM